MEMSELERLVAIDMIEFGYDFTNPADVDEYWTEIINTWTE